MSHRPLAVALMLCEQIILDERTKRVTPVNCFSQWKIEGDLSERHSFCVLAILASGHVRLSGELAIEHLNSGKTIFLREFALSFTNPLAHYRCILRVGMQFPAAGNYEACLYVERESVAVARFSIVHKE